MSKYLKLLCFILIFFCFHLGAFGQIIKKNDFQLNNDVTTTSQTDPSIAIDSVGNFVVVWTDIRNGNYDIYGQMCDDTGKLVGANFKVNNSEGTSLQQSLPDVARNPAGSFVVVWQDNRNGNYDIYAQRYNAAGTPQGSNLIVENGTASQISPSVAMDSLGNFVVVWQDSVNGNWDICGLRFNSSGVPQGTKFVVNNDLVDSSQLTPDVGMDGDGDFVVAWYDYRDGNPNIYFQRYNSAGTPQDTNLRANGDPGTSSQFEPAVCMNILGNFIIVWIDFRSGSVADIYAQRYNSTGETEGVNFKVNDVSAVLSRFAAVALTSSGEFVIAWSHNSADIYAQKYDSYGSKEDGNFLVNNASSASQSRPDVSSTGTYTYFVWQDNRSGNFDIYAKVVTWGWSEVPEDEENRASREFTLNQNYPNPFNPQTSISFYLKQSGKVSIKVYNILGQRVRDLVDEYYQNGDHRVDWNGKDDSGKDVSAGIYFYQIKTENSIQAKKMVLLR